jgi:hypothetical protein
VEAFAQVVFALPFETVLIESLFSIMGYNQDKTRSRLTDSKTADIIHAKDAQGAVATPTEEFAQSINLDSDRSLNHRISF